MIGSPDIIGINRSVSELTGKFVPFLCKASWVEAKRGFSLRVV
jgi:hypothetical protein